MVCCIVTIRDVQLAKANPAIKNSDPTAIRSVVLLMVIGLIVVSIDIFVILVYILH